VNALSVDLGNLHSVLKDQSRRKILAALKERGALTYTELLSVLVTTHTGRLNYHLKVLGDLIAKDDASRYVLTEKGETAVRILSRFPADNGRENGGNLPLSLTSVGKILAILGGAVYLLDTAYLFMGLDSIYWLQIFPPAVLSLVAVAIILKSGFSINTGGPSRVTTVAIRGAGMTFLGFFALELGLNDAYGSSFRNGLSLVDPAVLGFVLAIAGFLLSLSAVKARTFALTEA
jgi:hypothetical protein